MERHNKKISYHGYNPETRFFEVFRKLRVQAMMQSEFLEFPHEFLER